MYREGQFQFPKACFGCPKDTRCLSLSFPWQRHSVVLYILCAVLHCASIFVGLSWTQGRAAVNPLHKVGSTSRGCAGSWIRSSSVPSRDVNPKAHFAVHLLVAGLEQPGPHAHQWPEAQLAQTAHSRSCQIQSLSPCSLANFGNDCVVRKGRVFWTCFDSTVSP